MNLNFIMQQYPEYLNNRERLRAILTDLFPQEILPVNLVMIAYDAGIPSELSRQQSVSADEYRRICNRLVLEYGLTQNAAAMAVRFWAEAYGIHNNTAYTEAELGVQEPLEQHLTNVTATSNFVVGNPSDYEIGELSDGTVEIIKFTGPKEPTLIVPNMIAGKQVSSIRDSVFKGSLELRDVSISQGIRSIGSDVFNYCVNLSRVNLPSTLTSIGNNAFFRCNRLVDISFPLSLRTIGEGAFWGCSSLTQVLLPDGLKHIGRNCFANCKGLVKVFLPGTLETISERAFSGCGLINDVHFSKGLKSIQESAFSFTSIPSVILPEGLIKLDSSSFIDYNYRVETKEVYLPYSLTEIASDAFAVNSETVFYCHRGSKALEWALSKGVLVKDVNELPPKAVTP